MIRNKNIVKTNQCLSLFKIYSAVEIELQKFLTSVTDGGDQSASDSAWGKSPFFEQEARCLQRLSGSLKEKGTCCICRELKKQISAVPTPYCNPYTVQSIPVAKAVILFITFMAIIPNISRNLYISSNLKFLISYFYLCRSSR